MLICPELAPNYYKCHLLDSVSIIQDRPLTKASCIFSMSLCTDMLFNCASFEVSNIKNKPYVSMYSLSIYTVGACCKKKEVIAVKSN